MNKLTAILLLAAAVVCFAVAPVFAATQNHQWQVIRMSASGDVTGAEPSATAPGRVIKAIRVVPTEASKYYKLRIGTSTGNIIWETLKTTALTAENWADADIPIPAAGLSFTTDDTTPTIYLYISNTRGD